MNLNFIVGLQSIRRKDGEYYVTGVASYLTSGILETRTGREKFKHHRDKTKAQKFSKETAEHLVKRISAWGYFPVVLEVPLTENKS